MDIITVMNYVIITLLIGLVSFLLSFFIYITYNVIFKPTPKVTTAYLTDAYADYLPLYGLIRLSISVNEDNIEAMLEHEYLHWVLWKVNGWWAMTKLDNLSWITVMYALSS